MGLWEELVGCICRPPRDDQYTEEDLPGGVSGALNLSSRYRATRLDLTLVNKKGLKLQCSHLIPKGVKGKDGKLPCVIYCHCNSGSRRDAEEALHVLIPIGCSVFTLDFAGSGLSEGNWVTLGAHEVDDVEVAVQHLRASGLVSTLGLWGRSMGAVTALMYSARDPSIAGVVVDSPFAKLTDLMMEIVEEQQLPIPRMLTQGALFVMRHSVKRRAGFDITEVSPVDLVASSFTPALFGHAKDDTFIRMHHSERLYEAYAGDKNFIKVDGDHNSRRPEFFYQSVAIFFHNTLKLDEMLEGGNPLATDTMAHAERVHRRHHQQGSAATPTPRGSTPEARRPGASAALAPVPASLTAEMEGLRPQQQWPRRTKETRGPDSEDLEHFSRPGDRGGLAGVLSSSLAADSPTGLAADDEAELMEAIRLSLLDLTTTTTTTTTAPRHSSAAPATAATAGNGVAKTGAAKTGSAAASGGTSPSLGPGTSPALSPLAAGAAARPAARSGHSGLTPSPPLPASGPPAAAQAPQPLAPPAGPLPCQAQAQAPAAAATSGAGHDPFPLAPRSSLTAPHPPQPNAHSGRGGEGVGGGGGAWRGAAAQGGPAPGSVPGLPLPPPAAACSLESSQQVLLPNGHGGGEQEEDALLALALSLSLQEAARH